MSIELKQAAQQVLDAFEAFGEADDFATLFTLTQKMNVLHAAIQQAESEPVEPSARVELMKTGGNAGLSTRIIELGIATRERLRPGDLLYTHPAPGVPEDVVRDAERGRFLVGWLKRFGLLQTEYGQMGAGEKPESWWLLHAPWGIDKTRPFFGHGRTPEQAIDAAMTAAQAQKDGG